MRRLSRAAREVADRAARIGIDPEHLLDFEAARQRPLKRRMAMFFRTRKPILDDAPYRAFDSTADYRQWCNENLPMWLGYRSCGGEEQQPDGSEDDGASMADRIAAAGTTEQQPDGSEDDGAG